MHFFHLLELKGVRVTENSHGSSGLFKITTRISISNKIEVVYQQLSKTDDVTLLGDPVLPLFFLSNNICFLRLFTLFLEYSLFAIKVNSSQEVMVYLIIFVFLWHLLLLFKFFHSRRQVRVDFRYCHASHHHYSISGNIVLGCDN